MSMESVLYPWMKQIGHFENNLISLTLVINTCYLAISVADLPMTDTMYPA